MAAKTNIKIPDKREINLYYRLDRSTKPATIALYVLFALVVLLALGKVGVYDVLAEQRQVSETLAQRQDELAKYDAALAHYDEVQTEYTKYGSDYMSENERTLVDRLKVVDLVENTLMSSSTVESVSISGNSAAVRLSGVTLEQVSTLTRLLEDSPLVESVSVNTAASMEEKNGEYVQASTVTATMLIYVIDPEAGIEAAEGGEG